jgi:hypothetical protein
VAQSARDEAGAEIRRPVESGGVVAGKVGAEERQAHVGGPDGSGGGPDSAHRENRQHQEDPADETVSERTGAGSLQDHNSR